MTKCYDIEENSYQEVLQKLAMKLEQQKEELNKNQNCLIDDIDHLEQDLDTAKSKLILVEDLLSDIQEALMKGIPTEKDDK
jgi:hypothetical protein